VSLALAIAIAACAAWAYLLLGRGFFWRPRLLPRAPAPARWPSVAAIVPARNEAAHIGEAVASLLTQRYDGRFSVVVVDDHSSDSTAEIARAAAARLGMEDRLGIVAARALPPGWSGKLWALGEGVRAVEAAPEPPDLLLFTDADIAHHPANLAELAAALEHGQRDLVSLMVRLRCDALAERFLIPAFVFFFAMLYPFAWAADPRRLTAAAAGGCILVRRAAFAATGGFAAIRGELIDDCALARAMKRRGSILLALSRETRSLRPYPRVADVSAMVARTAYTQLRHNPLLLAATLAGLALVYLAPPLLLFAGGAPAWLGLAAWAAMSFAYAPMLRFYRCSLLWAPLLPAVAVVYLAATVQSALLHYRGRGGEWKGRVLWPSPP
jgi:hopene-associated glycosyltransferase HpnB